MKNALYIIWKLLFQIMRLFKCPDSSWQLFRLAPNRTIVSSYHEPAALWFAVWLSYPGQFSPRWAQPMFHDNQLSCGHHKGAVLTLCKLIQMSVLHPDPDEKSLKPIAGHDFHCESLFWNLLNWTAFVFLGLLRASCQPGQTVCWGIGEKRSLGLNMNLPSSQLTLTFHGDIQHT